MVLVKQAQQNSKFSRRVAIAAGVLITAGILSLGIFRNRLPATSSVSSELVTNPATPDSAPHDRFRNSQMHKTSRIGMPESTLLEELRQEYNEESITCHPDSKSIDYQFGDVSSYFHYPFWGSLNNPGSGAPEGYSPPFRLLDTIESSGSVELIGALRYMDSQGVLVNRPGRLIATKASLYVDEMLFSTTSDEFYPRACLFKSGESGWVTGYLVSVLVSRSIDGLLGDAEEHPPNRMLGLLPPALQSMYYDFLAYSLFGNDLSFSSEIISAVFDNLDASQSAQLISHLHGFARPNPHVKSNIARFIGCRDYGAGSCSNLSSSDALIAELSSRVLGE